MGNAEYMGVLFLTALNMNQIIIFLAFFGSAVLSEEVERKPKLFFVSTSATTTTYSSTISLDGMEPEGAVQPSTINREVDGEPLQDREGRFLLYWITTTSISTSTRSAQICRDLPRSVEIPGNTT